MDWYYSNSGLLLILKCLFAFEWTHGIVKKKKKCMFASVDWRGMEREN